MRPIDFRRSLRARELVRAPTKRPHVKQSPVREKMLRSITPLRFIMNTPITGDGGDRDSPVHDNHETEHETEHETGHAAAAGLLLRNSGEENGPGGIPVGEEHRGEGN